MAVGVDPELRLQIFEFSCFLLAEYVQTQYLLVLTHKQINLVIVCFPSTTNFHNNSVLQTKKSVITNVGFFFFFFHSANKDERLR